MQHIRDKMVYTKLPRAQATGVTQGDDAVEAVRLLELLEDHIPGPQAQDRDLVHHRLDRRVAHGVVGRVVVSGAVLDSCRGDDSGSNGRQRKWTDRDSNSAEADYFDRRRRSCSPALFISTARSRGLQWGESAMILPTSCSVWHHSQPP